ncbi:uncharacterized protein PHACADRAFT_189338 [Phanerochaete carnosa HHB-10118-sp]|uniref:Uncharacterized protein n=1 Tax=Phanerochaete carnosa (strain HHB-10118-sp) TaxID=650164 RepID=K5WL98_PHACS|nr:uncharacterized protein PHACADRAFT_189338 [Phanerochaete carnosa HHB-10118-sp]EKM60205.1 hypothetical protein PHACADRAFT_189338 [Phanerochaete carnosa HHB-10118-sp]
MARSAVACPLEAEVCLSAPPLKSPNMQATIHEQISSATLLIAHSNVPKLVLPFLHLK